MRSESPAPAAPLPAPSLPGLQASATLALFCLAHFFIDLYSSALSVFQPFLGRKLGLSLTQAGALGGLLVLSSSVSQPLYGFLSDRWPSRLYSVLAPAVAGLFICSLGKAPSFPAAIALLVLGGAGVASFHPHASARAARSALRNQGRWMAVFISSGTLGMALGPLFFSHLARTSGFEQVWIASLPGLLLSFLLWRFLPAESSIAGARPRVDWELLRLHRKPLLILYVGVFLRSIVQVTFAQFLVLYLTRERGYPVESAAAVLALYLAGGALGGFVGGNLADRFGSRAIMLVSFAFSTPLMSLFFLFPGPLGVAGLVLGGLVLLFTIPVNVLAGQRLVPSQAGTISALMMGFAWGAAGLVFIPFTGWLSDRTSLNTALSLLLVFPPLGWWITRQLPRDL